MEITLMQGLLLALIVFICQIDQQLEVFFWFRPIVVCFFLGIAFGDVQLGLQTGAVCELAYLGLLTVGGTVPPDPLVAGVMTFVLAYTTGVKAETALGLSLPFALLGQWVGIFFNTVYAGWMPVADKACEKADVKGLRNVLIYAAVIKALTIAILMFLAAYAAQQPIANFVAVFPVWLIHGFEVAGGLLPAVGLALLLKVMLKGNLIPYLLFGFLVATFINIGNVLPVAIIGCAIAYLNYLAEKKKQNVAVEGGYNENEGI